MAKKQLIQIHNEDCLSTLAGMEDDQVDLVITSPPYNMNLRIRNGKYCSRQIVKEFSTKYEGFDDNLPIDEYNQFHSQVLSELIRGGGLVFYNVCIVTGSKRSVFNMIGDFRDYLKDIIVWDKGYGQPAMQSQVLNRQTELLLVYQRPSSQKPLCPLLPSDVKLFLSLQYLVLTNIVFFLVPLQ